MFFKNFKNKLLLILLITILIIPTTVKGYSDSLILGGENIGIEIKSKGVLVVGFYNVLGSSPGKEAGLKKGDIIYRVDDTVINGITDLSQSFNNKKELKITYKRKGNSYSTTLKLKKEGSAYKTGIYVKDSIIGIGTLTYIDPETNKFGALGHEIIEQSTGIKFELREGKIFKSNVIGIDRAERGSVGEKNAIYDAKDVYGNIYKNKVTGIYGNYTKKYNKSNTIPISNNIEKGRASIVTVLNGNKKEEFSINILNIDKNNNTKNILFEVTDNKLLKQGNGIVQGMSGSPIIQNNNLVGAVTHVLVDDPHKGFGIIISNMLKESEED